MSVTKIGVESMKELRLRMPVLDVRSPSEYRHAHVPGAFSLPIFTDDERRMIGTAYKQESREKAIKIGLDAFGRKMVRMAEDAEHLLDSQKQKSRDVLVHCWRGGMRSSAVAWLLDLYGFKVHLLTGGHKSYRRSAITLLEKQYPLIILGGYTGSNKTGILHELAAAGKPVVDLEALAAHKGSAFGNLEQVDQPSQEHFENLLSEELLKCEGTGGPIWVEGESQRLGLVNIPTPFFATMRQSPLIFLDVPFDKRLQHIVKDYGRHDKDKLVNGIIRIKKRLGGLETREAVNFLLEDDVESCFSILLKYYDKLYLKSTYAKSDPAGRRIIHVSCPDTDAGTAAKKLITYV